MLWAACAAALVALAFVRPLDGTPWRDEIEYHLPTIRQFAAQWPHCDLSDYASATSPGYHLLLAGLRVAISVSDTGLLLANVALACGAAGVVIGWTLRAGRWGPLLAVPLLLSPYFVLGAIYLRPDHAGWAIVFLLTALSLRDRFNATSVLVGGGTLALLVFVRQSHLWCAAPLFMAALLPYGRRVDLKRAMLMAAACLPAVAVVYAFYRLWGGLVPPRFQTKEGLLPFGHSGWQHEGPNFAVPPMILALLGIAGALYLPAVWRRLAPFRDAWPMIAVGGLVALVVAVSVPTTWDDTHGRYSGLWNYTQHAPALAGRSLLIVPLAAAGGAIWAWLLASLSVRRRWIVGVTLLAFAAAQTANAMAWPKYYEPFVLALTAMVAAMLWERPGQSQKAS